MSKRVVNTNYPGGDPDPRVVAWFEANSIDTRTVPAAQEVLVTDGHMAYVEFLCNDDGTKILGGDGYLKQIKVVPLISAPETFGL
jgi:hypothetical protein